MPDQQQPAPESTLHPHPDTPANKETYHQGYKDGFQIGWKRCMNLLASSGSKDRQLSPSEFLPGTLHSRLLIRLTLSVPSQNTLPNGSEVWLRSLASIASLKFKN